MKKPIEISSTPHDGSNIAALRAIAEGTRISKILCDRWPAVFLVDDMVYLAAEEGVLFVQQTWPHFRQMARKGCAVGRQFD